MAARKWTKYGRADRPEYDLRADLCFPGTQVVLYPSRRGCREWRYKIRLITWCKTLETADYKNRKVRDYSLVTAKSKGEWIGRNCDWLTQAGIDLDAMEAWLEEDPARTKEEWVVIQKIKADQEREARKAELQENFPAA